MSVQLLVPGLAALQGQTLGDGIRVAILDGPVDVSHPCFAGARLTAVSTLVHDRAGPGRMSRHGTHVASVLLGQPGGALAGVAPRATGLLVPVFQDYREGELPQLDLARAIEQAVLAGAHVINISGGERSLEDQADPLLKRALRLAEDNDVLVVAAAGNEGCDCVHVPAALPSVLAVGALGRDGRPLPSSNWGGAYRRNGLLAAGERVPGAVPGGAAAEQSGTSFATPIVSGVAALLMSLQLRSRGTTSAREVRDALLTSTTPCVPGEGIDCDRYLGGVLNVARAHGSVLEKGTRTVMDDIGQGTHSAAASPGDDTGSGPTGEVPAAVSQPAPVAPPGWIAVPSASVQASALPGAPVGPASWPAGGPAATPFAGGLAFPMPALAPQQVAAPYEGAYLVPLPALVSPSGVAPATAQAVGAAPSAAVPAATALQPATGLAATVLAPPVRSAAGASGGCGCGGEPGGVCQCGTARAQYVYALGTIGFDFGTETRRDTFRQLMPSVVREGEGPDGSDVFVEANPFDVFQLTDYLDNNRHESTKLIWTLNLDLTPIYAIEAEPYYPEYVYDLLRTALRNEALSVEEPDYVARVSIPGVLTGRTVQLFSGQVVPVVVAQRRGMHSWNETRLLDSVITALRGGPDAPDFDEPTVRMTVRSFLDKVYFECRNLGQSPADRALNFAVTNAYQFGSGIANGLLTGRMNVVGAEEIIYTLDTIDVVKSPYCRIDSDCWDVRVKWFNPENDRSAKSVYQFTVDVNDVLPATLAPAHQFLTT
jgi:Subtilase family/PatG C-terminal/PatG Domain